MGKNLKPAETLNSIQDVLNAAKIAALGKIWIPENIKEKYVFVLDKKSNRTVIEKKKSLTKN